MHGKYCILGPSGDLWRELEKVHEISFRPSIFGFCSLPKCNENVAFWVPAETYEGSWKKFAKFRFGIASRSSVSKGIRTVLLIMKKFRNRDIFPHMKCKGFFEIVFNGGVGEAARRIGCRRSVRAARLGDPVRHVAHGLSSIPLWLPCGALRHALFVSLCSLRVSMLSSCLCALFVSLCSLRVHASKLKKKMFTQMPH